VVRQAALVVLVVLVLPLMPVVVME